MKVALIGAGSIGGAIVSGSIRSGVIGPGDIVISDPSSACRDTFLGMGVAATSDNASAVKGADVIIVAVKPWLTEQVLRGIAPVIDRAVQSVVSIAAGVEFCLLQEYLETEKFGPLPLFRVIPNTAIALGQSATFIAVAGIYPRQEAQVRRFFEATGKVYPVEERLMQAVTSLASSGIAYALKYIDSCLSGAESMGIDRAEALGIVIQTIKGALALLESSGSEPQDEIDRVTTPGGMTLKGLAVLEKGGFEQAVASALTDYDSI